tara:strand:+ start:419 stop:604 length:186 start_codon:yes stop_codon:yes gene_type:complete
MISIGAFQVSEIGFFSAAGKENNMPDNKITPASQFGLFSMLMLNRHFYADYRIVTDTVVPE